MEVCPPPLRWGDHFLSGHSPEQPGLGPIRATPATVEQGYTPRGTDTLHPGD